ncbi:hypothetical protein COCNU_scaffold015454G000030 [Cocos nucifera]|nr:hypothetical protein [Cocos nucifera]
MGIPWSRSPSATIIVISNSNGGSGGCLDLLELCLEGATLAYHAKNFALRRASCPSSSKPCLTAWSIGVIEGGMDEALVGLTIMEGSTLG